MRPTLLTKADYSDGDSERSPAVRTCRIGFFGFRAAPGAWQLRCDSVYLRPSVHLETLVGVSKTTSGDQNEHRDDRCCDEQLRQGSSSRRECMGRSPIREGFRDLGHRGPRSSPSFDGLAERPLVPNRGDDIRLPRDPLASNRPEETGFHGRIVSSEIEMNGAASSTGGPYDAATDGDGLTELMRFAAPDHDVSIRAYRGQSTTARGRNPGLRRANRSLRRPS